MLHPMFMSEIVMDDAFHSLLDEALIVAIASDYNLADPNAYDAAKATLEDIAQSVPSEEATGFNPSGIPIVPEGDSDGLKDEPTTTASVSQPASQTNATDPSSVGSAAADCSAAIPRLTSFDNDSQETKVLLLQSMFADLKPYDVEYALKKANGDVQTALDYLLNIQYLASTGQQMKGIDGFFTPEETAASSKGKRKRQGKKALSPSSDLSDTTPPNLEANSQDDIQFIAERFGMRSEEVSDAYQKCDRSKGATAVELLDQFLSHGIETQDEAGKEHADALARKYRHVPEKYMPTIVHVAGSIPQFADDLASLLNKHFTKQSKAQKLDLTYRLTPLPREEIEGSDVSASAGKSGGQVGLLGAKLHAAPSMDYSQAVQAANKHHQDRVDALSSAAQLHRRGASSPLYRQAAGYYTDRAREQARYAQQATATAADLLVQEQSTSNSIDLHGVVVQDGVRIARQKTQDWWQGLGEFRSKRAKEQGGFTVITGLGRHSAGGISQMRQAVAAALLQDGWKFHVETGRFVVTGRR
ncbi:smr domain-containing protein [Purpureocillium lilacinum]|uniref:Smr domain-containing protein n=1 Tax=Purpureocillium lilacinum TaxID=33203 RepID=A0A179GXY5_PURLI|nr:smr domain-containing protein [Purpureocillium lilacinum]